MKTQSWLATPNASVADDDDGPIADKDRLMTKQELASFRTELFKKLRAKGDPPPRLLTAGFSCRSDYSQNVAEVIKARGGRLVRGWKLYTIPLRKDLFGQDSFKGEFHIVAGIPSSGTHETYVDPNRASDPEDQFSEYIFMPSSRAHAELSDEEVLSGKYLFGTVVGGEPTFAAAAVADHRVRGRRKAVIGTSCEEVIASRRVKTLLYPLFWNWYELKEDPKPLGLDCDSLGELMGFPVCDVDTAVDVADAEAMVEMIEQNRKGAILNGKETFKLFIQFRKMMAREKLTAEEIKKIWCSHYDSRVLDLQRAVTDDLEVRFAEMC
mgnify:CR=1 FL=1